MIAGFNHDVSFFFVKNFFFFSMSIQPTRLRRTLIPGFVHVCAVVRVHPFKKDERVCETNFFFVALERAKYRSESIIII